MCPGTYIHRSELHEFEFNVMDNLYITWNAVGNLRDNMWGESEWH
jgi:hypothetical protein